MQLACLSDRERYTLHFTQSGYCVSVLDMLFNNTDSYGAVDYVVLYERGVVRAYLSPHGVKQARTIGAQLLDDDFYAVLTQEAQDLVVALLRYEQVSVSEETVRARWEEIKQLSDRFNRVYHLYEQPFQHALEERVCMYLPESVLQAVLHDTIPVSEIGVPEVERYLLRLMEMGDMKMRLHTASEQFVADGTLSRYVANMHNLPEHLVDEIRMAEFEDALNGRLVASVATLEARHRGSVLVRDGGVWSVYTDELYTQWYDRVQQSHSHEVRGRVACRGRAVGSVVKRLSWTDATPIPHGSVLVTGMTNPQMGPYIRDAAAIVTDEGGVACHAAIFAREYGIPCITGTQHATVLLEEGDVVEVCADTGVVTVLQKASELDA